MSEERLIKIISKGENEKDIVQFHTYEFLSSKPGQRILEYAKNRKEKLVCICTGSELPMHIAQYSNSYSVRTNPGTSHLHDKDCPHRSEMSTLTPVGIVEKENKDIELIYNNDGSVYFKFNFKENNIMVPSDSKSNISKNKVSIHRKINTNLYTVTETLLTVAWLNQSRKNSFIPWERNVFYEIYNNILENSVNTKGDKLNLFTYTPNYREKEYGGKDITNLVKKAVRAIKFKNNDLTLVIGKLVEITDFSLGQKKIKLIEPLNKGYYYLIVNENYLYRKYIDKNKIIEADYYFSALVRADLNLDVARLEVIPVIPDRGLPIDSSNEIEFAKMLIRNKVFFTKPTMAMDGYDWDGYIPDFLILDKLTKKTIMIAEVFRYYSKEYLEEMEEKIKYYSSNNKYQFIYWKSNKGDPMPEITNEKVSGK